MYGKILVGYDGSDQAEDAVALGQQLADLSGAQLVLAGVFQFDPLWGGPDPAVRDVEAELAHQVEQAAKRAGAEPEAVPGSSPARGLHELAEEIDADLIVVGSSHHSRIGQILAGSVGLALLHGSPCAVAVAPLGYREREDSGIQRVVVGFDGSADSSQALAAAVELARDKDLELKLVAVAEPPAVGVGKGSGGRLEWHELKEAIEEELHGRMRKATETVPKGIKVEATLITGDPAECLADAAEPPGNILLLGSRGYGPVRRVLLGSVASQLVRSARSPLLVHPRGAKASAEGAMSGAELETGS